MKKNTGLMLSEIRGPLKNLLDNLSGLDGHYWLSTLKKVLRKENPFEEKMDAPSTRQVYEVEVDGTKTLKQLVANGKYEHISNEDRRDICEKNFPIKDKTKRVVTIELFHFSNDVFLKRVQRAMYKEEYRPAMIEELLALSAQYPELQKKFPIVALGSQWCNSSGFICIPILLGMGLPPFRCLALSYEDGSGAGHPDLNNMENWCWTSNCRFAVVRGPWDPID